MDRRQFLTVLGGSMALGPALRSVAAGSSGAYEPTWESIEKHPVPDWFHNAKFGIFIHWGVYAVPGWAPLGEYAEWYPRRMYDEGSATYKYHKEKYGPPDEFTYADFIPMFKAEKWDPDRWAELFDEIGARYVVPVGEHHDGFAMWDSDLTEYDAADMGPERDIIGELGRACRDRGMKYGPSYHRMMNYYDPSNPTKAFGNPHYTSDGPKPKFVEGWQARWRELCDKYQPDLMWWDGDWMAPVETWKSKQMVAEYYNLAREWGKEVLVNDRLGQVRGKRGDFYTQEYEYGIKGQKILPHKWESCRGVGHSFGYNRQEGPEDYSTTRGLVTKLIDTVSKNGNLLLNVGPKANGVIPEVQRQRLRGIGQWLDVNGEAIFGTRPWKTYGEEGVRFTRKGDSVYAVCMGWPGTEATLGALGFDSEHAPGNVSSVRMLGSDEKLSWSQEADGLKVKTPDKQPCQHAFTFKIVFSS